MKKKLSYQLAASIFATLSLSACLTSCGDSNQGQVASLPEYPVVKVDTSSAVIFTEFASELQSGVVVEIRPRVSGYIDKIYIKEGSHVEKDQVLFQINTDDLMEEHNATIANVDAAVAQVENAKLEVRKLTPLVEKGIISSFELENANSNLAAAIAKLNYAKSQCKNADINVKYATITSPVSGVVGRIVVREGTLISTSNTDPLTSVSGDGDVSAYFSIDESSMMELASTVSGKTMDEKIRKIPMINLIMSNGQIYDHAGHLELASGLVDMTTGSMQVKGVFTNPDNRLRSGSSGVVRISSPMHGVILVPQKATYELQDKIMVYVVDADGKISSRKINIEGKSGQSYVISGGLNAGETILYDGIDYVKEGDQIKPTLTQVAEVDQK